MPMEHAQEEGGEWSGGSRGISRTQLATLKNKKIWRRSHLGKKILKKIVYLFFSPLGCNARFGSLKGNQLVSVSGCAL